MMPFILALKNIISRRSSYFIILFMTFAAALLCVTNAVFDSTEQGIGDTYMRSFTGDFIIRPVADMQSSLFGDETPITGDLTELPHIAPYNDICKLLDSDSKIEIYVPQMSSYARIESDTARRDRAIFGVPGVDYINTMSSISVIDGTPYTVGQRGVMVSQSLADSLRVSVGDTVQLTVADNMTFRIRAVPVSAIYDYEIPNDVFNRFVLLDPNTFRALFDISDAVADGMEVTDEQSSMLGSDLDLDTLFGDNSDFSVIDEAGEWDLSRDMIFAESATDTAAAPNATTASTEYEQVSDGTIWNFIICRVRKGASAHIVMSRLNRTFKTNGWPVEVVSWRFAAGGAAIYLYFLRIILNAGILIVLAAGFIVINNTLVINVLDRTKEIGTMRAIGAGRFFISLECMAETFIMAIVAAIFGIILGAVATTAITHANIVFANEFLVQLFGGESLAISVTTTTIRNIFIFMMILGVLGWIYPVGTALRVSPLEAMSGAK